VLPAAAADDSRTDIKTTKPDDSRTDIKPDDSRTDIKTTKPDDSRTDIKIPSKGTSVQASQQSIQALATGHGETTERLLFREPTNATMDAMITAVRRERGEGLVVREVERGGGGGGGGGGRGDGVLKAKLRRLITASRGNLDSIQGNIVDLEAYSVLFFLLVPPLLFFLWRETTLSPL
jgi:hypothetical protein